MNIPKHVADYRNELELKNYSFNTIKNYVSIVESFLIYFDSSFSEPKKIPTEKIKLYIKESKSISVLKQRIGAIKRTRIPEYHSYLHTRIT